MDPSRSVAVAAACPADVPRQVVAWSGTLPEIVRYEMRFLVWPLNGAGAAATCSLRNKCFACDIERMTCWRSKWHRAAMAEIDMQVRPSLRQARQVLGVLSDGFKHIAPGAVGVALLALSGCTSLLPQGRSLSGGGWQSYGQAEQLVKSIRPYVTSRSDLRAAGLDPFTNPNITILTFSDVVQRFNVGSMLRREEIDRGIQDCLKAGKSCIAYSVTQRQVERKRSGNFWLDILNFSRETDVLGWSFNALVVMVDDTVVYTLHGGQPRIHEHEATRNPLGPLQGFAERRAQSIGL